MTNLILYGGSEYLTSNEMYDGVVPAPGSLPTGDVSFTIYLGPTVPGLTWGSNPTRTTYTPPILLPMPPVALDLSITEGLNLSSDDEKETNGLPSTYSDSRGVGAQWSNNRVVVASNATSSQLVSGDFGFKIPPNAVIKSVEIDLTDVVVAGSLTSETVDVLTCAFTPSSLNANVAGMWAPRFDTLIYSGGNTTLSDVSGYYNFDMTPIVSAFPVGFQPGVSYTKLKLTFTQGTNPQTGLVYVTIVDSTYLSVGAAHATLRQTTSIIVPFGNTGEPFNNNYIIAFNMPNFLAATDSITLTQIEFFL